MGEGGGLARNAYFAYVVGGGGGGGSRGKMLMGKIGILIHL